MNRRHRPIPRALFAAALVAVASAPGCGKPNRANIELRKRNQNLEAEVAQLKQAREADRATIEGLSNRIGTVPTLPPARLDRLFTASSMKLGRLSGGVDTDPSKAGDEGFKVYVELFDQHNDEIKSAGSFVVEAFDLAAGREPLKLGRWEFPVEQAQQNWYSFFTRYEYVLNAAWQGATPRSEQVTVNVTFTDELTGRKFTQQQLIKVTPPPTPAGSPPPAPEPARPTMQPATRPTADSR